VNLDELNDIPLIPSSQIKEPKDFFFIPDNYEYVKVRCKDILFVEADGSYVKIHTTGKVLQISTNLKNFEEQFEHFDFLRVSRKHIININFTERINGVHLVIKDYDDAEYKIPFSKRKRHEILDALPVIRVKH
jgi:DNA-binding LytR/AlgR family response regulator